MAITSAAIPAPMPALAPVERGFDADFKAVSSLTSVALLDDRAEVVTLIVSVSEVELALVVLDVENDDWKTIPLVVLGVTDCETTLFWSGGPAVPVMDCNALLTTDGKVPFMSVSEKRSEKLTTVPPLIADTNLRKYAFRTLAPSPGDSDAKALLPSVKSPEATRVDNSIYVVSSFPPAHKKSW